jgi:hypothetical protein
MRFIVGRLLLLFPPDFRKTFGAELMTTFEDRWRDRRGLRSAIRIILDLIRSAALEQAASWQRPKAAHPKGNSMMLTFGRDLRFALRTLR